MHGRDSRSIRLSGGSYPCQTGGGRIFFLASCISSAMSGKVAHGRMVQLCPLPADRRPWDGVFMRAQLLPLDGGPPIEIVKDLTVVGRKEECDVRLDHKSVSKMHCVIVKTDGLLLLRDLGSTNGTRVNGQRVRRAALLPNDQLTRAHFKFRVNLGPDVPSPASPPAPVNAAEHTQAL